MSDGNIRKFLLTLAVAAMGFAMSSFASAVCRKCVYGGSGLTSTSACQQAAHMETGSTTCSASYLDEDGIPFQATCLMRNTWDMKNGRQCDWNSDNPDCFYICTKYESHCHGSPNCSAYDPPPGDGSPILINFGQGSWDISGLDDGVLFDMRGEGVVEKWTWPRGELRFLAHDRDDNGTIDSGYEIYGDYTPLPEERMYSNGFVWLEAYDKNGDRFITAADAVWTKLLLWHDASPRDGKSQPHELTPVASSGIEWIAVDYHTTARRDGQGNFFRLKSEMKRNGRVEPVYDVYFSKAR